MKIELKNLTLTNFKGIQSFSTSFDHVTNICGDNATGKTSLKDAFLWLFFGKDSSDRKDFEIKTLDENNKPYHKRDHEVEAIIDLDGEELNIRRSLREKWVKKRGEQESIFSGHETAFFWNDVPMKEGEFQGKVASVFNENIFKLITNTDYFNSLKWQERRAVLMSIGGAISNDEVFDSIMTASNKQNFTALINALNQKKTVDDFKKEIGAKKKKLKDELEQLPVRINEANRSLPEEKNKALIEKSIADAEQVLTTIEDLMMNKTSAQKKHQEMISALLNEKDGYNHQLMTIEFEVKNAVKDSRQQREQVITDKKREKRGKEDEKSRLTTDYVTEEKKKSGLEIIAADLRTKWHAVNNEQLVFNENEFHCPACKREYEASNVEEKKEELTSNFNTSKSTRLAEITERGKKVADDIKILISSLENITSKGQLLKSQIEILASDINILEEEHQRLYTNEALEIERTIATDTRHKELKNKIASLDDQINTPFKEADTSESMSRKRELKTKIDGFKIELASIAQRQSILNRIAELNQQESTMAQELASLEGTEFSIEQFIKAKMDTLESRINGRFKIVRFKLFEDQINGGQVEACTTLINGVPYSDANTAARIQAGLDIINTLSDHYDTYGPVWVDNRESVIRLPETKSQLINLIVSEQHKKLTVLRNEEMAMA